MGRENVELLVEQVFLKHQQTATYSQMQASWVSQVIKMF